MKIFGDFDAIKFPEENLIFITHNGFLYYIYNSQYGHWRRHRNAGNDRLTVANYPDVSREELMDAMGGMFPQKETDFMRLCNPSQLCIRDMIDLFVNDYPNYMSDYPINYAIHELLLESAVCHKSFLEIKKLLDAAIESRKDNALVLDEIKELSFTILGRDIFKREIRIVDGHNGSSYFWIMPARVIDYSDTDDSDNIAKMWSSEISIEEEDVSQYLSPFLYKHFDDKLKANKMRSNSRWIDDDGTEQFYSISGFAWYLTHNFFTFDSINALLGDIRDTMDALSSGRENEFTAELKTKIETCELLYEKRLSEEENAAYNANRPKEDDTELELVLDFYRRFIYRMEYMLQVGKEKGYDLISFMGP